MTARTKTTLRMGPNERQAIARLKGDTHEATAAKAIFRAVREWPRLRADLEAANVELDRLRSVIRRLHEAELAAEAASKRLAEARRAVAAEEPGLIDSFD